MSKLLDHLLAQIPPGVKVTEAWGQDLDAWASDLDSWGSDLKGWVRDEDEKNEGKHSSASSEEIIGGSEMPRPTFDTEGDELLNLTGWEKGVEEDAAPAFRAAFRDPATGKVWVPDSRIHDLSQLPPEAPQDWQVQAKFEAGFVIDGQFLTRGAAAKKYGSGETIGLQDYFRFREALGNMDCPCGHGAPDHGIGWGSGKHVRFRFTKPPTPIKGTACSQCTCPEFEKRPEWMKNATVVNVPKKGPKQEMAWHGIELHKKFAKPDNTFTGKNVCWRCGHHLSQSVPGHPRICPQCWTPAFESVTLVNAMLDEWASDEMCPCGDDIHAHLHNEGACKKCPCKKYGVGFQHIRLQAGEAMLNEALTQDDAQVIQSGINAPHVQCGLSTLGGVERASVMIAFSLDPKETWVNNIFENSRYARFMYDSDGRLEMFAGGGRRDKHVNWVTFRRTKAASAQDVVRKINAWIAKVSGQGEGAVDFERTILGVLEEAGDPKDVCDCKHPRSEHRSTTGCNQCECGAFSGEKATKFDKFEPEECKEGFERTIGAALNEWLPPFGFGSTQIWYFKGNLGRDLMMGYDFCAEKGCLPDPGNLPKTHVLMGKMKETDPETIFRMMQGENWSPNGEARSFVSNKGAYHTSMSVGDVIVINGHALMVDNTGFKDLSEGKMREDDEGDFPTCPMCGGPGVPLGRMGRLEHYRCRNCGMNFSREIEEGFEATIKAELGEEFNRFDTAEGYYWWLADHHKGQWSDEYARLSKLSKSFKPGAASNGPSTEGSREVYRSLCAKEGCTHDPYDMGEAAGDDFKVTADKYAKEYPCTQCGKPNYGWILGPVCGNCCRNTHARVAGGKAKVNRKPYTEANEANFERFADAYRRALAWAMEANPDDYMTPGTKVGNIVGLDAGPLADKMLDSIKTKGIGAVNINSKSFKRACKELGINCTYKAIKAFLGEAKAPKLVSALLGEENLRYHDCGDAGEEVYDAQGIYLCRACPKCRKAKLAGYRPEILTGYTQADVDEPIEPEEATARTLVNTVLSEEPVTITVNVDAAKPEPSPPKTQPVAPEVEVALCGRCGHSDLEHTGDNRRCLHRPNEAENKPRCDCQRFIKRETRSVAGEPIVGRCSECGFQGKVTPLLQTKGVGFYDETAQLCDECLKGRQ